MGYYEEITCPWCFGVGTQNANKCHDCNGRGHIKVPPSSESYLEYLEDVRQANMKVNKARRKAKELKKNAERTMAGTSSGGDSSGTGGANTEGSNKPVPEELQKDVD